MGPRRAAINLTMGKNALPYQDVMSMNPAQTRFAFAARYNIPSMRGSHSEISGT